MNREDIILISLPFILSAVIIFGHYRILLGKNPNAHSRPLITYDTVQNVDENTLQPNSPTLPLPSNINGLISEVPTNDTQLNEIKTNLQNAEANVLVVRIGLKVNTEDRLIVTSTEQIEEKLFIRWVKKTVSEVHKLGYHIHLMFYLEEEPVLNDIENFRQDLKNIVEVWSDISQQYFVSYFDPGITIGHPTFASLPPAVLAQLTKDIEQTTRKYYTGRIGLQVCCGKLDENPSGYNFLSIITRTDDINSKYEAMLTSLAKTFKLEQVIIVNLSSNQSRSIYQRN